MRRPSSIDRLPKEVREAIGRLREGGSTIDEILAHLHQMEAAVSRSALGRHVKSLDEIGERMRRSRAMAEALTDKFGQDPDNRVARVNLELLHGLVFETLTAGASADEENNGEGAPLVLDPQSAKLLSETLRNLATAQKSDADRMIVARREAAKEAAKAVDEVAANGERGLSADTVELIKQRILGIGK
jgi:hypothetical protein